MCTEARSSHDNFYLKASLTSNASHRYKESRRFLVRDGQVLIVGERLYWLRPLVEETTVDSVNIAYTGRRKDFVPRFESRSILQVCDRSAFRTIEESNH